MSNGWGNGMWKKAVKNGAAVTAGVLLSNISDPTLPLYSLPWFKHVAFACLTVFLVTELAYIKNWLGEGNGETPPKV